MATSSTENLLPHKSLSDLKSMHQYLNQKINQTKALSDLLPFIKSLIGIDALKSQLISSLNKQYEIEQESDQHENFSIRSLFISSCIFNGIPSDIMHANIISYLPSSDFKNLSLISKHFRTILLNHPFIFNSKRYKIHFTDQPLDLIFRFNHNNDDIDNIINMDIDQVVTQKFTIDHHSKLISINLEKLKQDNDTLTQLRPLLHNIKVYNLSHEPTLNVIQHLSKTNINKQIQKLELKSFKAIDKVINNNNGWEFENCVSLSFMCDDPQTAPTINNNSIFSNPTMFGALECLELIVKDSISNSFSQYQSRSNYHDMYGLHHHRYHHRSSGHLSNAFYDNLNALLSYLSETLLCLTLRYESKSEHNYRPSYSSHSQDKFLKIPKNIEWLNISNIANCRFDISECNNLMVMKLENGVEYNNIIWSKNKKYIIPYVYIEYDDSHYDDNYLDNSAMFIHEQLPSEKLPNVRFIDWRLGQSAMQYTIQEIMVELETNDGYDCNGNIDVICLKLKNKRNLFEELMEYKYKSDVTLKDEKISQVEKWWSVNSAQWIQSLE